MKGIWKVRKFWTKTKVNVIVFLFLCLVSLVSIRVVQDVMLKNAQSTGDELARSYSVEEEKNITTYEILLNVCEHYMVEYVRNGNDIEGFQVWLAQFYESICDIFNSGVADPYAVIGGKIVAANPWEGDESYAATETEWYRRALDADGSVVFTDAYIDVITGKPVVTIAKKSRNSDNVVAFDIFPENFRVNSNSQGLPDDSSYFLCDSAGTLLYSEIIYSISEEELREYVFEIAEKIKSGELEDPKAAIQDPQGRKRAVYYNVADNGWLSIVTTPYDLLLEDLRHIEVWFIGVLLLFFLIVLFMNIREYALNKSIERTNETVRVLGNSYYAIYRVDFKAGTYEMIKGSDYVRRRLNPKGDYEEFLKVSSEVIDRDVCEEFLEAFSIENIKRLVKHRVRDFGGDFKRLFNGEYHWVSVRLLFDESLNTGEVVLCFREIDQEKGEQLRQMELLKDTLEAMKKSEESKNQFFANMSHDMRTPLNAIIGLSELAQGNLNNREKSLDYLKKINRSSRQLLALINDILEISKLEKEKMTLDLKPLSLKKCLKECADTFRIQAEDEGKELNFQCAVQDEEVYADPVRLTQIINNLLSNAVKFTGEDGRIDLNLRQIENQEQEKYQITVTDTGCGMTKEFLDKIFIPYERDIQFGARSVMGTGLGMPIVQNIVLSMGGTITVSSELGVGSTFTVTLPFEVVKNSEKAAEAVCEAETEENCLDGAKILLAEDNELNMEIASEVLESQGALVIQAWNGAEAVEKFQESEPFSIRAVLMDMQMPVMNGCEAARTIRALNRADGASVPIIAVTANAFAEDIAATAEAGMNCHISKPIDFALLKRTLMELDAGHGKKGGI